MRPAFRNAAFVGLMVLGGLLGLNASRASAQTVVPPSLPPANQPYQVAPSYYPTVPQYGYTTRPRLGYRFFGPRRFFNSGPRYYRAGRRIGWRRFRY